MSKFGREARRLKQEVAARQEWIEEILRLDPERQRRLYRWLDAEEREVPGIEEVSEQIMLSVEGGSIRILHTPPGGAAPDSASRPILFVPGWGAVPEEFREYYELLHGEVELYYLETREKPSSILSRKGPEMTVSRSARDIGAAIRELKLENREFVLMGSCWGASIILQGLHDGILEAPTVLAVDPMQRLWFPRWLLRFVFRWTPDFVVTFLKPIIVRLKLLGMNEPRQRERAEQFIRAADVGKWRAGAVAARNFQLAGKLESIAEEVFVLNCSDDAIHDQRFYPVLTDRLPRGRFLSLQVDESHRERMMGLAAREFARTPSEEGVPESLREYETLG